MELIKDGDKYIKAEYEALSAVLAGGPLEQKFHIDMYRFACWVLTIDELLPADKMDYISTITGMGVTRKRVKAVLALPGTKPAAGHISAGAGSHIAAPEIIRRLTEQDIATGNTFGPEAESLTERCLRFMELFAYGICTVGRRKFSRLEKETVESTISAMRAEMRRTFEQAEKGGSDPVEDPSGAKATADLQAAPTMQHRQNPMNPAARDRLIVELLQEPAPAVKPGKSPLQLSRGYKLLVACVICILVGIFLIAVVILLIDESKSNVAVLESYTGTDYTKEQIAGFIQEQKDAQKLSLLNMLWTILTQILPGILGWAALKWGRKPLVCGEILSIVGMIRTVVMLVMGPSWMALAEVPQLVWIVFAERYRRCLEE